MRCSSLSLHAGQNRWVGALIALVLLCGSLSTLLLAKQADAVTTVPTKMNFQGRLTDSSGNIVANGQYNATFRLFTASSGGSAVWSEVRETTSRIQVTNGLFSVQLGDVTPIPASLFASGSLYFEIELPSTATATCSTASCADYTGNPNVMSPRNPLATSAYAFNSETLDGLDSAAFVQGSANNTLTGTNLFQTTNAAAVKIQNAGGTLDLFAADTSAGKVGIGLANPTLGKLHVTWLSGDSVPAIYGGSSSGSNGQIGVQGVSGTGTGIQGVSGSGTGVLGTSTSSNGVQGRSDTGISGLFLSTNTSGGNSAATLVTRASTSQPGDLFQAQDSGSNALFKIAVDGSVRTKVGTGLDSATAFVIQNAGGTSLLTADGINNRIYIGSTSADSTGVILVLDTKNTAGDPTGVNGAMYYNSSLGRFRCYQNSSWFDCVSPTGNLSSTYYYLNEFNGTAVDGTLLDKVSGSGANQNDGVDENHPGSVRVSATAVADRGGYISGNSTSNAQMLLLGNGTTATFRALTRLSATSNATDAYTARVGFIDDVVADSQEGCYYRYTHGTNSGEWQGVCRDNGTESVCDTNIAGSASWIKMEIGVNSTGTSAAFVLDGTQACTITTNIPVTSGRRTGFGVTFIKSAGTTLRYIVMDYLEVRIDGLTR